MLHLHLYGQTPSLTFQHTSSKLCHNWLRCIYVISPVRLAANSERASTKGNTSSGTYCSQTKHHFYLKNKAHKQDKMNHGPNGQLFQSEQTDKTAHPKMISHLFIFKEEKMWCKKRVHYLPVKVAHLVQVINGDGHLCQVKPGHVFLQLVSMSKQTQHIHTCANPQSIWLYFKKCTVFCLFCFQFKFQDGI